MQKRQARQYAFVNGFKNVAWLTGYIQRRSGDCLHLSSGRSGVTLPVLLEASLTRHPWDAGQAVSIYCRITTVAEGKQCVPILKAIGIDRPSLINLTPREIFRMALEDPSVHAGDSAAPTDPAGPHVNTVHLSGLLERMEGIADSRHQALKLFIKQHDKHETSIPVRIHGKHLAQYRKRLQVGMPVFIEGQYRVKIDGRHDRLEPMIHTTDVRVPQRGKDMLALPAWAFRYMSERTSDPELRQYIEQMSARDGLHAPAGGTPDVIEEL